MKPKLPVGTLDRLWADARNWRAGLIYSCKEDPRIVVPKRQRWRGWTLNFAHSAAWPVLVVYALAIGALLARLALAKGSERGPWLALFAVLLAATMLVCGRLASPKRHEGGVTCGE
jgi:hypothetical protein